MLVLGHLSLSTLTFIGAVAIATRIFPLRSPTHLSFRLDFHFSGIPET